MSEQEKKDTKELESDKSEIRWQVCFWAIIIVEYMHMISTEEKKSKIEWDSYIHMFMATLGTDQLILCMVLPQVHLNL